MISTERDVFQMKEVTVLGALWKHVYNKIRFKQYTAKMPCCRVFVFLHFESDRVRWAWVLSRWPPDCRMMVDYSEASVVCSQRSEINHTASLCQLKLSAQLNSSADNMTVILYSVILMNLCAVLDYITVHFHFTILTSFGLIFASPCYINLCIWILT